MRVTSASAIRRSSQSKSSQPGEFAPAVSPRAAATERSAVPNPGPRPRLFLLPTVPGHAEPARGLAAPPATQVWELDFAARLSPETLVEMFWLRALDDPKDGDQDDARSRFALVNHLLARESEPREDQPRETAGASGEQSRPRLVLLPPG